MKDYTKLKTPFGILNGKIYHISEILEDKKDVKFTCEECGTLLSVAAFGSELKRKHFKHVETERNCTGEGTIHKFWKQKFIEQKYLNLGELGKCEVVKAKNEVKLGFKNGFEDELSEFVIVDCLFLVKDKNGKEHNVVVEICSKNKKSEKQIELFQRLGVRAFEFTVANKEVFEMSKENFVKGLMKFEDINPYGSWKERILEVKSEAASIREKVEKEKHKLASKQKENVAYVENLRSMEREILAKKQEFEARNIGALTLIAAEEQLKEIESAIKVRMKELNMLSINELECTRKVNETLEERVKRANKAILEAMKQGFKTDYKF